MPSDAAPPASDGDRILICNPTSGDGQHTAAVYDLAGEYDFTVHETTSAEDIVDKAARAAPDASILAAAGGDGTLTRVVRGMDRADAFQDTQFGIVPTGTGNNFAGNVGIEGIGHAFEVIDSGARRRIDVGTVTASRADGSAGEAALAGENGGSDAAETGGNDGTGERGASDEHDEVAIPFVNSCVGGLTAEASGETDPEDKSRLGVLAYVMTTLQRMTEYDGVRLHVEAAGERAWTGEAVMLMVGNGRRFPVEGRTQANMEDGLFDVAVVEEQPTIDLAGQAAVARLFGEETEHIDRFKSPALRVETLDGPTEFSLDGEMVSADAVRMETRADALELPVGPDYEPDPA